MEYGLAESALSSIKNAFSSFKQIEKVILYGSRAQGNYKPYSDIDITIIGAETNLKVINSLALILDDLMLPYTFDISIYNQISNTELIDHIDRVGKIIYQRDI